MISSCMLYSVCKLRDKLISKDYKTNITGEISTRKKTRRNRWRRSILLENQENTLLTTLTIIRQYKMFERNKMKKINKIITKGPGPGPSPIVNIIRYTTNHYNTF